MTPPMFGNRCADLCAPRDTQCFVQDAAITGGCVRETLTGARRMGDHVAPASPFRLREIESHNPTTLRRADPWLVDLFSPECPATRRNVVEVFVAEYRRGPFGLISFGHFSILG